MALVVTIATVDRTAIIKEDTISISQLADSFVFTAELTIFDEFGNITIVAGSHKVADEITLVDGATTFFGGYVANQDIESLEDGSRNLKLQCQGYGILVKEATVEFEEYTEVALSDAEIIVDLFTEYCPAVTVDYSPPAGGGHVDTLIPRLWISFPEKTLAECMEGICQRHTGRWYVDNEKELHYFASELGDCGFDLDDVPDQVTSFSYHDDPDKRVDGTQIVNRVRVVGSEGFADTYNDVPSQTAYGIRAAIVRDTSLTTADELDERGAALLLRYKDPRVSYIVRTAHGGAVAGQKIDLKCIVLGLPALTQFTIRELYIYWELGEPVYEMTLGEAEILSLRATGAVPAWAGDIIVQHHPRLHEITNVLDHSVTGPALDVLGATAVNTIGLITPSSDPGAATAILKTDASGRLHLVELHVDTIRDEAGGDITIVPAGGDVILDGDLEFVGAQTIRTTADSLTLAPRADLDLSPHPDGDRRVRATSGVRLQSDNYASQVTGWGISYAGSGDFRYLYADELHAKAFIADLEQALAGGQIICKSVAPLAVYFTVPAPGGNAPIVVESFKGFDTFRVFVDNDVIRLRQFDRAGTSLSITNCWGTVLWGSTDEENKTQTYIFYRSAAPNAGEIATDAIIAAGTLALDYGTTGNGFYEVSSIDGAMAENSPYAQVATWTTHPHSGLALRSRFGNLKGVFNTANEFGLYAGDPFIGDGTPPEPSTKYLRISNEAIEAHNLPIKMYDGASTTVYLNPDIPSIALGATVPTGYLVNNGIWMGKDTVYKARIGTVSGGALTAGLAWDGTNLSIIGSITITGGSGYANISDKPTTLGAINAGEGTKLTGIAAGATVGATWGTNLYDIPATLGAPAGSGLFLSSTYMGYYVDAAWKTYIANDGKFAFAGDADNYVTWNGTALAVKGNIIVGDTGIFNPTDGKLLLGPGCERTATSWKSLRGQRATIANAFQTAAGSFPGSQGIVMEPGCTNLVANPSFETNTTGWSTAAANTIARSDEQSRFGDYSLKCTFQDQIYAGFYAVTLTAAIHYLSTWIFVPSDWDGGAIYLLLANFTGSSGSTIIKAWSPGVDPVGRWVQISCHNTPVAGDLAGHIQILATELPTAGRYIYLDGFQVEANNFTTTCIGSMPWCDWSDGDHASTSVRVGTTMQIPTAGNVDPAKGSIVIWFKIPTAFNQFGGYLFRAGNVNNAFDAYVAGEAVVFNLNGGEACSHSPVSLGVEHCIIFEWEYEVGVTDYSELFFDGVSVDTGAMGGVPVTLGANMGIGYNPAGSATNLCGVVTEYAVFGDLLSPNEAAAIWNLRRATVDHGAIDSPGIYITDGKFKIASSTSGSRIELTADEIATYNGANKINEIDSDGISVLVSTSFYDVRSYQFRTAVGAVISRLAGYQHVGNAQNHVELTAHSITGYNSNIWIHADTPAGKLASVTVSAYQAANKYANLDCTVTAAGVSTITCAIDTGIKLSVNAKGRLLLTGTDDDMGYATDGPDTDGGDRWQLGGAEAITPTGVVRWVQVWINGGLWNLYAQALN